MGVPCTQFLPVGQRVFWARPDHGQSYVHISAFSRPSPEHVSACSRLDRQLVVVQSRRRTIADRVTANLREDTGHICDDTSKLTKPDGATSPTVSVIVPVYNKAPYLASCLESILSQTLRGLEVICVDDASTDGSGDILDRFAESDSRVTILRHDRNRGAAAARNAGLDAAGGEFVQFTDADDLLTRDALKLLVAKARKDQVDVVRGGIVGFRGEISAEELPLSIPDAKSRLAPLEDESLWAPWWHTSYVFSRRFLSSHQIHYPDLCSGEDPVFLAEVLTCVPRMSTISEVTYRHRLIPLGKKGRTTYRHLSDYLRHAELIRALFLRARPDAWYLGFSPQLLPEVRSMIDDWEMTPSERRRAASELERIFELPRTVSAVPRRRKLMFMYVACGLGGVETSILNKTRGLADAGVEVCALFRSSWGEGGKLLARYPGFIVEADEEAQKSFIVEWAPDAIAVVDTPRFVAVAKESGVKCPVLFETHTSDLEAFDNWGILAGASNPRVAKVVVPSEFNREILVDRGLDARRVRIVPNPVDLERFRPRHDTNLLKRFNLPRDCPLLLFTGRLEPLKNPLEFVTICAELLRHDHNIHGVVLGDAVNTMEYAASVRAAAASIRARLTFIPRVSYEEMPSLYEAVAASEGCLISTSLRESQPMVVLEAMAYGCPVVVSDVGGVAEIVSDGRTGHLYQLGEVQGATDAVVRLINDSAHRRAMVTAATRYVRSAHSPMRAAEAYIAILDEVGGSHDPAYAS